ncbi:hypothetical protein [Methanoregula sp.]|uniref:hypothetical protein n=1 Tax=Methanoregula sp. TaxID=2052170 RepID=UPI003568B3DB
MRKFCHEEWCLEFFKQVIQTKGTSIFFTGTPGSGKSQKDRYFLQYFAPFETVIKWDTGKDDIQLCFTLGKPVQILIPLGCKFEMRGEVPAEYVITPVPIPEITWRLIKPGWINIISMRNYYLDEKNLKSDVRAMFKNFLLRLRLDEFKNWLPAVFDADEAHVILGNLRIDASADGKQTGQDVANILKECRSKGLRWLIISQGYYDIQGTARENTPCYVVSRGTVVDRRDNPKLNYLSGFARSCESKHGWIVLPNGDHYGKTSPIPFPYFEPMKTRIIYRGFVDEEKDMADDSEMLRGDPGVFASQMFEPEHSPAIPSRYAVYDGVNQ